MSYDVRWTLGTGGPMIWPETSNGLAVQEHPSPGTRRLRS